METRINRQWRLAARPEGMVGAEHFRWIEEPAPELTADGQLLVRTLYLSCDPTQRGWMARDTYLPAVAIGEVMRSFGVGRVVESRHPRVAVGRLVQGQLGWQDYALLDGGSPGLSVIPDGIEIPIAMSVLGVTGLTAYFGETLDAALARLAFGGRVVVCGAIADYNRSELHPGPRHYLNLLLQRGRMEGFLVLDYLDRAGEAVAELRRWLEAGEMEVRVDIQEGLENAPRALRRLFTGANLGKQLLRIA